MWHAVCIDKTQLNLIQTKLVMQKQKGNIGVTTDNIFPVIKKFLYSDHEIFLREIVSNAVDATQKLKTLNETGKFSGDMGDLTVGSRLTRRLAH